MSDSIWKDVLTDLRDYLLSEGGDVATDPRVPTAFLPYNARHKWQFGIQKPTINLNFPQLHNEGHDLQDIVSIFSHELGHFNQFHHNWIDRLSRNLRHKYRVPLVSDDPDINRELGIREFILPVEHHGWDEGKRIMRSRGLPVPPSFEDVKHFGLGTYYMNFGHGEFTPDQSDLLRKELSKVRMNPNARIKHPIVTPEGYDRRIMQILQDFYENKWANRRGEGMIKLSKRDNFEFEDYMLNILTGKGNTPREELAMRWRLFPELYDLQKFEKELDLVDRLNETNDPRELSEILQSEAVTPYSMMAFDFDWEKDDPRDWHSHWQLDPESPRSRIVFDKRDGWKVYELSDDYGTLLERLDHFNNAHRRKKKK